LEPSEITFGGPTPELHPKGMQFITFHDLKPENKTQRKQYLLLKTAPFSSTSPTLPHTQPLVS
jgi:hypothetical protein